MKNHWQTILSEIKNEIEAAFDGAIPENYSLGKQEEVAYSISFGSGIREAAGYKRMTIRREIIVRLKRFNAECDLGFKADLARDISKLIINIEENPQFNAGAAPLISYVGDEGIVEMFESRVISYGTQIKFLTEVVEHFEEDYREKNRKKIDAKRRKK